MTKPFDANQLYVNKIKTLITEYFRLVDGIFYSLADNSPKREKIINDFMTTAVDLCKSLRFFQQIYPPRLYVFMCDRDRIKICEVKLPLTPKAQKSWIKKEHLKKFVDYKDSINWGIVVIVDNHFEGFLETDENKKPINKQNLDEAFACYNNYKSKVTRLPEMYEL